MESHQNDDQKLLNDDFSVSADDVNPSGDSLAGLDQTEEKKSGKKQEEAKPKRQRGKVFPEVQDDAVSKMMEMYRKRKTQENDSVTTEDKTQPGPNKKRRNLKTTVQGAELPFFVVDDKPGPSPITMRRNMEEFERARNNTFQIDFKKKSPVKVESKSLKEKAVESKSQDRRKILTRAAAKLLASEPKEITSTVSPQQEKSLEILQNIANREKTASGKRATDAQNKKKKDIQKRKKAPSQFLCGHKKFKDFTIQLASEKEFHIACETIPLIQSSVEDVILEIVKKAKAFTEKEKRKRLNAYDIARVAIIDYQIIWDPFSEATTFNMSKYSVKRLCTAAGVSGINNCVHSTIQVLAEALVLEIMKKSKSSWVSAGAPTTTIRYIDIALALLEVKAKATPKTKNTSPSPASTNQHENGEFVDVTENQVDEDISSDGKMAEEE